MRRMTCARPYARAAFAEACGQGTQEKWARALQVAACVAGHPRMKRILTCPVIPVSEQLGNLLTVTGETDPRIKNFISVLAGYRRLSLLPEIIAEFNRLKAAHENVQNVTLHCASAPEETVQQKLQEKLTQRLGRQVRIHLQTGSSVSGGMKICADNQVVDDTVQARLAKLAQILIP